MPVVVQLFGGLALPNPSEVSAGVPNPHLDIIQPVVAEPSESTPQDTLHLPPFDDLSFRIR
jgi:hypothetical protein